MQAGCGKYVAAHIETEKPLRALGLVKGLEKTFVAGSQERIWREKRGALSHARMRHGPEPIRRTSVAKKLVGSPKIPSPTAAFLAQVSVAAESSGSNTQSLAMSSVKVGIGLGEGTNPNHPASAGFCASV